MLTTKQGAARLRLRKMEPATGSNPEPQWIL
ncbi:hypothetical protein MTY_2710 [Moorella thermoacetica Y72]|uniref:Uncharacterized protein n=1 Tax=Moorella thermoacetica Y72 TaxID=1325331 RepID=A0A0S6UIJ2_NEOTH|nr:hypothetical protein MTY_2710 [Moorella thermoacetica Y72]